MSDDSEMEYDDDEDSDDDYENAEEEPNILEILEARAQAEKLEPEEPEQEEPVPKKVRRKTPEYDPIRKEQDLELLVLRKPTKNDRIAEGVPKPVKPALPTNPLPRWRLLNLDEKVPLVPAPNGTFVNFRAEVSKPLYVQNNYGFDTSDPFMHETTTGYTALHDPHLKYFFQTQPNLFKRLIGMGLLTPKGEVICTLAELNKYRLYMSRIHKLQLSAERQKQEEWDNCQKKHIKSVEDAIRRDIRLKRNELRLLRRLQILQDNERRIQALRAKWREHPSNNYAETRAHEQSMAKRIRELKRAHVARRIAALRESQQKRIKRIILHILCEEEFSEQLRAFLCTQKFVNHQADLKSFSENKRRYQEDKIRYHTALLRRNVIERKCRIRNRELGYTLIAQREKELATRKKVQKKLKAEREMYLMEKYGRHWLRLTRRYHQNEAHQSLWKARNVLVEGNKTLKEFAQCEGIGLGNLMQTLLGKKLGTTTNIRKNLDEAADDTYAEMLEKLSQCVINYVVEEAGKKILDYVCREGIDPKDLVKPVIPNRKRNQIQLEPPHRPCSGPCAQFGRGEEWARRCGKMTQELTSLKTELKKNLNKKLSGLLRRGLKSDDDWKKFRDNVSRVESNADIVTAIDTVAGITMDRASPNPANPKMQKDFQDYATTKIAKSLTDGLDTDDVTKVRKPSREIPKKSSVPKGSEQLNEIETVRKKSTPSGIPKDATSKPSPDDSKPGKSTEKSDKDSNLTVLNEPIADEEGQPLQDSGQVPAPSSQIPITAKTSEVPIAEQPKDASLMPEKSKEAGPLAEKTNEAAQISEKPKEAVPISEKQKEAVPMSEKQEEAVPISEKAGEATSTTEKPGEAPITEQQGEGGPITEEETDQTSSQVLAPATEIPVAEKPKEAPATEKSKDEAPIADKSKGVPATDKSKEAPIAEKSKEPVSAESAQVPAPAFEIPIAEKPTEVPVSEKPAEAVPIAEKPAAPISVAGEQPIQGPLDVPRPSSKLPVTEKEKEAPISEKPTEATSIPETAEEPISVGEDKPPQTSVLVPAPTSETPVTEKSTEEAPITGKEEEGAPITEKPRDSITEKEKQGEPINDKEKEPISGEEEKPPRGSKEVPAPSSEIPATEKPAEGAPISEKPLGGTEGEQSTEGPVPPSETPATEKTKEGEPIAETPTETAPETDKPTEQPGEPTAKKSTGEEPSTEKRTSEEPIKEKTEEQPITEGFTEEQPITEGTPEEQPITEGSPEQQPITGASTEEQSIADSGAEGVPIAEKSGEPIAEKPITETSKEEKSITETSKEEESITETSAQEEPITETSKSDEPITDQQTAGEPITEKQGQEPITEPQTEGAAIAENEEQEQRIAENEEDEQRIAENEQEAEGMGEKPPKSAFSGDLSECVTGKISEIVQRAIRAACGQVCPAPKSAQPCNDQAILDNYAAKLTAQALQQACATRDTGSGPDQPRVSSGDWTQCLANKAGDIVRKAILEGRADQLVSAALQHACATRDAAQNPEVSSGYLSECLSGNASDLVHKAICAACGEIHTASQPCDESKALEGYAEQIAAGALKQAQQTKVLENYADKIAAGALQRACADRPATLETYADKIAAGALQRANADRPAILENYADKIAAGALQRACADRATGGDVSECVSGTASEIVQKAICAACGHISSHPDDETAMLEGYADQIAARALQRARTSTDPQVSSGDWTESVSGKASDIVQKAICVACGRLRDASKAPQLKNEAERLEGYADQVATGALRQAQAVNAAQQKSAKPHVRIASQDLVQSRRDLESSRAGQSVNIRIPSSDSLGPSTAQILVAPRLLPTQSDMRRDITPSQFQNMTYNFDPSASMVGMVRAEGKLDVHEGQAPIRPSLAASQFFPQVQGQGQSQGQGQRSFEGQGPSGGYHEHFLTRTGPGSAPTDAPAARDPGQHDYANRGNVYPAEVHTEVQGHLRRLRRELDQLSEMLRDAGIPVDNSQAPPPPPPQPKP